MLNKKVVEHVNVQIKIKVQLRSHVIGMECTQIYMYMYLLSTAVRNSSLPASPRMANIWQGWQILAKTYVAIW